jgi:Tfp pilus assembly protein PilO
MRSTLTIKGMVITLLVFFIGVSLLLLFFLYMPRLSKERKDRRAIASLDGKVRKTIQEINKIREEIEGFNKEDVNVDYFKRHQIPPEQRTPTFLAKVNDVVNRLGIKTIMVKPMPQEESPDYIRYPFLVETKSKYEEIVKFVDSLENSFGLNLDELQIKNDPKDPLWHRLKFTVSTFELKRPESSPPEKMEEVEDFPIQVMVRDDIAVKRDPFFEKELEREKRIATAAISKRRPRRLPPLKLKGIIDIAGTKVAIINDKIVREGDWIARYRIVKIGEDEVIALYGRKKRILKIKELVKMK